MTFKREKQRGQNRAQRRIRRFEGYHAGMGRTDLPDQFADCEDWFFEDHAMRVKDGRLQIGSGLSDTVESLIEINLAGARSLGTIAAGSLTVQAVSELT